MTGSKDNIFYLPSDLSAMIWVGGLLPKIEIKDNRKCFFNVSKIEERQKQLGVFEDIDFEVVEPLMIENKP